MDDRKLSNTAVWQVPKKDAASLRARRKCILKSQMLEGYVPLLFSPAGFAELKSEILGHSDAFLRRMWYSSLSHWR